MVRVAPGSAMRTKRTGERRSTAISGTNETPIPAPTSPSKLENCPLSKTTWGETRARSQAAKAFSRKQCPSRRSRKGSLRKSRRAMAVRRARMCFLGRAANSGSVRRGSTSNSCPRTGKASIAMSILPDRRRSRRTGVISSITVTADSEKRREKVRSDGGNGSYSDVARDGILAFDDIAASGFEFAKNCACTRKKRFADSGKADGTAETIEEARTELGFELKDLLGERGLRHVRVFGGAGETAGFDDS